MRLLFIIVVLAMLVSSGVAAPVAAEAGIGVTVSINAPNKVAPGIDFTATIDLSQVANLDAVNYDVSFDSTVLRLDNVTNGDIAGTVIPVAIWNERSSGTYTIVQNIPGLTGANGTGYLAVLHFHVIGSVGNTTDIGLSNGMLSSNLAQGIPATWIGDSVEVLVIPGDANGDGIINALDITKLERIIGGLDEPTPGADANQDSNINVMDITKLESLIAELN